jgi:hypothetical protein
MTDAPETMPDTLAAWRFHAANRDEWLEGGWSLEHDCKATSYTRTDHSQALIAAAYEAAAKVCEAPIECGCSACNGRHDEARISLDFAGENVRALTPADAKAALDKLIADAERRGMERAAVICTGIIKNYDVMKPNGTTYESLNVQKAAKGMVSLARADIRAAMEDKP